MDPHRTQRVSEAIREELSEIVSYEMDDPRIGAADITEVLVSPDLRHARVRLHLPGGGAEREGTLQALDGARHYLRRELAGRLRLYRVPELHFEADLETASTGRVASLLRRARKGRPRDGSEQKKASE